MQLPLFTPALVEPSVFARIGAWMVGDGPEPRELAIARAVRLVAETHRARVRASWGGGR